MHVTSTRISLVALTAAIAACGLFDDGGGGGGFDPIDSVASCGTGGGNIEGQVLAPNGTTPVVGATVAIEAVSGCTVQSGDQGRYRLEGVPEGATTLRIQRGVFDQTTSVNVAAGQTAVGNATLDPSGIQMGVVEGSYDEVQAFLTELGIPFTVLTFEAVVAGPISSYDGIFLNCGLDTSALYNTSGGYSVGALAQYVTDGGHVYASDWASEVVKLGWPSRATWIEPTEKVGIEGAYTGALLDPVLQTTIGATRLAIEYDLGGWSVIDSVPSGTEVLVRGTLNGYDPTTFEERAYADKPWLIRFDEGAGSVTYTSFHNHAQLDEHTHALLLQLVLGI